MKAQVVVDQTTRQILCTALGKGRVHDLRLLEQLCLADKGYQGIFKLHFISCTPTNKPRKSKLDKYERQYNRLLAQFWVSAEHVNQRNDKFFGFWRDRALQPL